MTKKEILKALTCFADESKILRGSRVIKSLISEFNTVRREEEKDLEEKQLDLNIDIEIDKDNAEFNIKIQTLIDDILKKKNVLLEKMASVQNEALISKQELLLRFKDLLQNEESISTAFIKLTEIQKEWKEVGEVTLEKREEINQTYNQLNESFYYNIKIFKELKNNDLKRNYSLKNNLIHEMELLVNQNNIKKTELQLRSIQDRWAETGGTFKEDWEKLKKRYWAALNANQKKIKDYYVEQRKKNEERLVCKTEVVKKIQNLLATPPTEQKEWQKYFREFDSLQRNWNGVGYTPKKESEAVWLEFKALRSKFFALRNDYYKSINESANESATKKKDLIKLAEDALKNEDKEVGKKTIINLQKDWKSIGFAGKRLDNKLWKQFHHICNSFFDQITQKKEKIAAEEKANIQKKKEVLDKFKKQKITDNNGLDAIRQVLDNFSAIETPATQNTKELYKSLDEVIQPILKNSKASPFEKEKLLFKIKLEKLSNFPNSEKTLSKERDLLKKEINSNKAILTRYETNMSFFGKGTESLLKAAKVQAENTKKRIEELLILIKMIP